jgi:basic amino acid/polyamine antiporter, APA family
VPAAQPSLPLSTASIDEGLQRAIGPFALGANAVNLAVGAGIFALPATVAALLGPAAVLAYLLCGATITCVLLCCAEFGSQITRSGGVMAYIEDAFGPMAGFLAWALYAVGCCALADAAIAHVLMDALAFAAPALQGGVPRSVAFALLFGSLAAVNIRGVRYGTSLSVLTTLVKLAPLVVLIGAGLFAMRRETLEWTGLPSVDALGDASLLVFFIFMSPEGALTPSGEIRDPVRTVPRGILGAAATLVVLYVALQVVSEGVLGQELARQGSAPLAAVAARLFGAAGRDLLLACAAIAVFGSIAADMINTPRAFFAAANARLLPAVLTTVHRRFRTPDVAIAVYALLVFVFAVSGAFRPLAVLATISQLLIYLFVCLGVLRVRRLRPRVPGAFRAPGGPVIPLLGATAVLWLLSRSTAAEIGGIILMIAAAAGFYAIRTSRRQSFSPDA